VPLADEYTVSVAQRSAAGYLGLIGGVAVPP
jgi:hypothetical protein